MESNKIEFSILWFFCNLLWFFKDSTEIYIKEKEKNHLEKQPGRSYVWFQKMSVDVLPPATRHGVPGTVICLEEYRRLQELNGKRKETVDLSWFRPSTVVE